MKTTAYHPQTNGQTERFNKTVTEIIRKYIENGFEKWDNIIPLFKTVFAESNLILNRYNELNQKLHHF